MIILAPFAQALRSGARNPKDYDRWPEVIELVKARWPEQALVQVGSSREPQLVPDFRPDLSLADLRALTLEADACLAVDSFYQHFAWDLGLRGVIVFSQSDPNIFGHPEHVNLVDRARLREHQFWLWEQAAYVPEAFPEPTEVVEALASLLSTRQRSTVQEST